MSALGLDSPIRGYPKEINPRCTICKHPHVDAVDHLLVAGQGDGKMIGRAQIARSLGVSISMVDRHALHRKDWIDAMRGGISEIGNRVAVMSARDMAQKIFDTAIGHAESAQESGAAMTDLAHLTEPLRIAAAAAEFVGKVTGEVRDTPVGSVGNGGSVSVIMMPRLGELPPPIIDIQPTEARASVVIEKELEDGSRQESRTEPEVRDAGSGGETVQCDGDSDSGGELPLGGVSEDSGSSKRSGSELRSARNPGDAVFDEPEHLGGDRAGH